LNEQRTLRQRDLLVVWITASNTPEPVKAALRSVCNSVLVRRPLHAARLKELFQQVAQEGGDSFHMSKLEKPTVILSSNVIHYAKQQEWDDPYDCKTELPYAPLTNHEDSSLTASKENLASAVDSTPVVVCKSSQKEQLTQSSPFGSRTVPRNRRSKKKPTGSKGVDSLSKPLDKLEILVAEDNPLLRKLAVAMLRRLGAATYEAANGQEALEAVMSRVQGGERSFHCILMDCQVHHSLQHVDSTNNTQGS
jgi:CheY-like chemotaxis protein